MVTRTLIPILKVSIIVALATAMAACTGKKSERTHHDGPIRTDYGPRMNKAEAQNAVLKMYADSGKAAAVFNDPKASVQQILSTLGTMADVILNTSVIENPELSSRTEFKSILGTFNRGLNRAIEMDLAAVRKSGLLKRYQDILLDGAEEDSLAQTFNLPLFKDHLTSHILTTIAKELVPSILEGRNGHKTARGTQLFEIDARYAGAVAKYYRLLFAAYEVSTRNPNDELNLAYVQMAQDYYEMIRIRGSHVASSKNPAMAKAELNEIHRRHNINFNMALTQIRDRFKSQKKRTEYCKFVMETNPLSFEVAQSNDFDRQTLRFFVAEYIECAAPGKDNSVLKSKISERLAIEKKNAVILRADDLKKEQAPENRKNLIKIEDHNIAYVNQELAEIPKIVQNLGVEPDMAADPIVAFVIDQLFYERIDQTMARSYWSKIRNVNDKDIIKYIRNYARAQMVNELKNTLENFAKILRNEFEKRGGLGTGYFDDVIKGVNNQSQLGWEILKTRERFLRDFLTFAFDQKLKKGEARTEYLNLREELDSINEHMGISVLAPMNMVLNYYMSKAQGTIKVFLPWWPGSNQYFTADARYALMTFLVSSGPEYQFFRLADQLYDMDRLKKMHAVDFAFRTGIFELLPFDLMEEDQKAKLKDATPLANNHYLFYRQIFKDVFNIFDSQFKIQNTRLDNIVDNRHFSERLLNACQDPMGMPLTLDTMDLKSGTLMGDEELITPVKALYDTDQFMSGWRSMRDLVRSYIGVLRAQRDNSGIVEVEKEFARYEQMERKFYGKVFEIDRKLVDNQHNCLWTLHKADYLRRDIILKANIEYYKDVHAAMKLLNLTDGQPVDVAMNSAESLIANWEAKNKSAEGMDVGRRMRRLFGKVKLNGLANLKAGTLEGGLNAVLSIHNYDQAPFISPNKETGEDIEVGYYVTGAPPFSKDQRELKHLNKFDKETFGQAQWDTLMRVRRQLQTQWGDADETNKLLGTTYKSNYIVGQSVDVPIGSSFGELEKDGLYGDNKVKHVNFYESQTAFVSAAMVQFAGYDAGSQLLDWISDSGLGASLVTKRFSWMMELSEFGAIELSETDPAKCEHDEWGNSIATRDIYGNVLVPITEANKDCQAVKVVPKNIIDAFIELGNFVKLSDFDKEMLIWTNRIGKNWGLASLFFGYRNELSTAKWTWFDEFYRKFLVTETQYKAKSTGGYDRISIETLRGREQFENYRDSYLLNVRPPRHLLPLSAAPTQLERNDLRRVMITHINDITAYEDVIAQKEDAAKADPSKDLGTIEFERTPVKTQRGDEEYHDGLWRFVPVNIRPKGDKREGTPIYLEDKDRTKEWYSSYLETFFVKETECEALPKLTDPDIKMPEDVLAKVTSEKLSCLARFNAWREWRDKNLRTGGTNGSVTDQR